MGLSVLIGTLSLEEHENCSTGCAELLASARGQDCTFLYTHPPNSRLPRGLGDSEE